MKLQYSTLIKFSLQSLLANRLRSSLTILGMVIGVGAVILMMAIGQGAQDSVAEQIQSLGSNMVIVTPGAAGQVAKGSGGAKTNLTMDDAEAIAQLPFVKQMAPEVKGQGILAMYKGNTWTTSLTGSTINWFDLKSLTLKEGRFFTIEENDERAMVAVIGQTVAQNLFPSGEDPIGKEIMANNTNLTIIGVYNPVGASSGGQDQDDMIYIPARTAQIRFLGQNYVNAIDVQVDKIEDIDTVIDNITFLMRERHYITNPDNDDFNIKNMSQIVEKSQSVTQLLTILLAGVAAISLVVGGIGIMNIMLVSVTERTREIGVRMAVGATESDILKQFLLEAIFLSLGGGTIGVVSGTIGSYLFAYFSKWPMSISTASVVLSMGFAAVVGIFFGYYPARKAAALNPSDALSFE